MTTVMTQDGPKTLTRPVAIDCELYNRLHRLLAPLAGGDWEQAEDLVAAMRRMEPEAADLLDAMERAAFPPGNDAEADAAAAGWFDTHG